MNRLAEKIKAARVKAKMTEKELAKKSGLSVGYIIQIESGKKIIKEEFADKIFKALGEKSERLEDVKPSKNIEPIKKKKVISEPTVQVSPNAQWADALAGVIKTYPVTDCESGKVVSHKDMPILKKKIFGHHPDKIMFVHASNDEMKAHRIRKGDIVVIAKTQNIQNGKLYLVQHGQQRSIRIVRKEGNKQLSLLKSLKGDTPVRVDQKNVQIIGECVSVSFTL